jgi:hypothetical protein
MGAFSPCIPQSSALPIKETSIKKSPQKCFSTLKEKVENNTKSASKNDAMLEKRCFNTEANLR